MELVIDVCSGDLDGGEHGRRQERATARIALAASYHLGNHLQDAEAATDDPGMAVEDEPQRL